MPPENDIETAIENTVAEAVEEVAPVIAEEITDEITEVIEEAEEKEQEQWNQLKTELLSKMESQQQEMATMKSELQTLVLSLPALLESAVSVAAMREQQSNLSAASTETSPEIPPPNSPLPTVEVITPAPESPVTGEQQEKAKVPRYRLL